MDWLNLSWGDLSQHGTALVSVITWVSVAGLVLCSVVVLAIVIERLVMLRRKRIMPSGFLDQIRIYWYRGDIQGALACCDEQRAAVARIVKAGLTRHQASVSEIEKALESAGQFEATGLNSHVRGLGLVANLAPMLGFLGTVTGMIKAFNAIAAAGTSNPSLVASGISEALLTTAAGLVVGIPSLALFHFFRGRADRFIVEMEEVALALLEDLTHPRQRVRPAEEQADAL
jgi:biopolymer transport protein ExbB